MAEIMAKFRIKYTSLKMVDDISIAPRQDTQNFFDKLISDFQRNDPSDNSGLNIYHCNKMIVYQKSSMKCFL